MDRRGVLKSAAGLLGFISSRNWSMSGPPAGSPLGQFIESSCVRVSGVAMAQPIEVLEPLNPLRDLLKAAQYLAQDRIDRHYREDLGQRIEERPWEKLLIWCSLCGFYDFNFRTASIRSDTLNLWVEGYGCVDCLARFGLEPDGNGDVRLAVGDGT